MAEREKVTVYPYNKVFAPFIKYFSDFNDRLAIGSLVSPKGFCLAGKDAGTVDNRGLLNLSVTNDLQEAIAQDDAFLAVDGEYGQSVRSNVFKGIDRAIELGKNIYCALPLSPDERQEIETKCAENKLTFKYYGREVDNGDATAAEGKKLYRPSVPVIFVGDLFDRLNSLDVLLSLRKAFADEGHRVCSIGVPPCCGLLNMHPMPLLFMQPQYGEVDKIRFFNNYIRLLEKQERPDIIMIQLPGGMMKFNDVITNGFGVHSYMISQAITPDFFVLSVPYEMADSKLCAMINENFKYRFGFEIDCIQMSNARMDTIKAFEDEKLAFSYMPQHRVDATIRELRACAAIDLFNIFNEEDREALSRKAIQSLSGYGIVQVI